MKRNADKPKWSPAVMLALGMILIFIHGCATLDQIVQKPKVVFDSLNIENASLLNSTLVFNFKIDNPNPIGLRASRAAYDLKINGRPFTQGNLDHGISVPAGSIGHMRVPVTVAYLDFFDSIKTMVKNKTAAYELTGTVAVGPLTLPFKTTGKIDLPRLPKISLAAVRIESLSMSGARLNCRLQMENPNAFNLLFKQMNYTLKLGNTRIAKAQAAPQGSFGRKGPSTIDMALDLSFADIGRAGYQALLGKSSNYQINGQMTIDSPNSKERLIPFSSSGRVPLWR